MTLEASVLLLFSLLLPWLAAALLFTRLWPVGAPGRLAAATGYGYFAGMFGVALLLLALEAVTGQWQFGLVLAAMVLLTILGLWLNRGMLRLRPRPGRWPKVLAECWSEVPLLAKLGAVVLLALVSWRLTTMLLEVLWRPVYAWDAFHLWSYHARAYLELGYRVPNVSDLDWLGGDAEGLPVGRRHPATVSVIQLWPALALGRWHEVLVNIPWFLAAGALPLAVYGQLRLLACSGLVSGLAAYLVLSVPLFSIHGAVGGYADIWLAAVMAMGGMALFGLLSQRRWAYAVLFLLAVATVPFVKQIGVLLALALVMSLLLGWLRLRWFAAAVFSGLTLLGLGLAIGVEFTVPGLGVVTLAWGEIRVPVGGVLEFQPHWWALFYRLFIDVTFHLFPLIPVFCIGMTLPYLREFPGHRGLWILTVGLVGMTLVVYTATEQAQALEDGTAFGRHVLAFVPLIVFWAATVVSARLGSETMRHSLS